MKRNKGRLTVLKIREILRLHFEAKLSSRQIGDSLHISKTAVAHCLGRCSHAGVSWPLPEQISDDELYKQLYPDPPVKEGAPPSPDWEAMHRDMSRPHVTLQMLYEEYRKAYPKFCMGRTQFYEHYRRYRLTQMEPCMRFVHKGGEKLFLDFSGDGLRYIVRETGEIVPVVLFVASWGASSYSFAEAAMNRTIPNWIRLHVRMLRFFSCVPAVMVPDNEKAGVIEASAYDPVLHPTYAALGEHYNTVILPTRPNKPRDKAVVECNVLNVQRFILGRLRDRIFFSLAEINEAIRELLEEYNNRPMQQYKQSRLQRFEELDKPYTKPLPADDFPYVTIKVNVCVHRDYHIEYNKHYYSVPYTLCGERVEVRQTNQFVEIFHKHERVASHALSTALYRPTTNPEHMPKDHQFVKGWSAEYFIRKAIDIGPHTAKLCESILKRRRHPEEAYRSLMGLFSLCKKYPDIRIENASARALHFNQPTKKTFLRILEQGLDKKPLPQSTVQPSQQAPQLSLFHENIRGPEYYADRKEVV